MAIDLIKDPLGFLFLYFAAGITAEGIISLLKLALITSIIAFPLVLLARFLNRKISGRWQVPPVLLAYVITLIISLVFWIAVWTWYSFLA
jgi:uncharacterized membrane-anchored protein